MPHVNCPNCNVANDPASQQCSICKTPLDAQIVAAASGRDAFQWAFISGVLSLVSFLVIWVCGLHPVLLLFAVFYAPMLTAYFSRGGAVRPAVIGMLIVMAIVVLIAVVGSDTNKVRFAGLFADPPEKLRNVHLFFGMVAAVGALLPIGLVGASVGQQLGMRRKRGA